VFDFLAGPIAQAIVAIHEVTRHVGGPGSGASWALAIVLLTVVVRLLLFPLFVKQIHSQRKMQALQPKMKELQNKHKGDKETLNQEMMKLYKEHGANPVAGCLPLILQMPVFFALFTVLRSFQPVARATAEACNGKFIEGGFCFRPAFGIDAETVAQAGQAKVFGAPIASNFLSNPNILKALDTSSAVVKAVTLGFILFMGISTFITQKQLMAKNGVVEGPAATQQKVLLYVMPVMLAVFGINVALGVLIYWSTTNVWSMAQQRVVIAKMGEVTPATTDRPPVVPPLKTGSKPQANKPSPNGTPVTPDLAETAENAGTVEDIKPAVPVKPPASGANRNRKKGQRRGGRR
jgi:YidC/Oxa1 family membrane protein insertase